MYTHTYTYLHTSKYRHTITVSHMCVILYIIMVTIGSTGPSFSALIKPTWIWLLRFVRPTKPKFTLHRYLVGASIGQNIYIIYINYIYTLCNIYLLYVCICIHIYFQSGFQFTFFFHLFVHLIFNPCFNSSRYPSRKVIQLQRFFNYSYKDFFIKITKIHFKSQIFKNKC